MFYRKEPFIIDLREAQALIYKYKEEESNELFLSLVFWSREIDSFEFAQKLLMALGFVPTKSHPTTMQLYIEVDFAS